MKTTRLAALAAALILIAPALSARNTSNCNNSNNAACTEKCKTEQPANPYLLMGGPGIVTSESATPNQLPTAAQDFLQTYYSRVMVGPITHNVIKDTYSVELGNGVKVTFNAQGKVDDIQAPYPDSLYAPAIKAVLPAKAYTHLEQAGLLYDVTGIKNAAGKGLRVQLLNAMPPEMLFDLDGLFLIVED